MNKYNITKKIIDDENVIYLAKDIDQDTQVVIKRCNANTTLQLQSEIHLMKKLRHPNIIICYNIIKESEYIYFVLEYASKGNIFKMNVNETELKIIILQLVKAVYYCHENCVIHRDIKPENIVMTENGGIKLIDFGWSCIYDENNPIQERAGTTIYNSPEMILKQTHTYKIDSWQIGILIFEMLTNRLPFDGRNSSIIRKRIVNSNPKYPKYFSSQVVKLLRRTFQKEPVNRASSEEILQHKWLDN